MANLRIEAGQLDGIAYVGLEPPLSNEQIEPLNNAHENDESIPAHFNGSMFAFRPDTQDFGDTLSLNAKERIMKMAGVLIKAGNNVEVFETRIGWGYWLFDSDASKTPIIATDVELQRSNEESLVELVGMSGGWGAVLASGNLKNVARILDADADNDLSGLRLVAKRNAEANIIVDKHPKDDSVSPEAARHWLLHDGRAEELVTGELRLRLNEEEKTDHMSLAGLLIAQGEEACSFDQAYRAMSPKSSLTSDVLQEAGNYINNLYQNR